MKRLLFLIFIVCLSTNLSAQEFSYRGYVKHLSALNSASNFSPIYYNGIVHHRLETTTKFPYNLTMKADFRNRIFYGYSVDDSGFYAQLLNQDGGWLDLTFVPYESNQLIFQSVIDRLQLNWNHNNFDITLGRQRINWGKSFVWSPNDLFNNYAFLDFDYEERPGSDAVSFVWSYDFASDIQFAFKPADDTKDLVFAGLWRTNIESISYDVQLLIGSYRQDFLLGGGWSGYLKDAGFSGEFSVFNPFENNAVLSFSSGIDYQFSDGPYVRFEGLYNGSYSNATVNGGNLFLPPSPKNLFPSRQAVYLTSSFTVTPLVQAGLGVLSSLDAKLHAFLPQISYSVSQNVDFLVIAQVFSGDLFDGFESQKQTVFFRFKWSY